jgi:crossover junction endodeoxyribonuclease RusA
MNRLVLPYPPSANHYLKRTRNGVFRTKEANDYRETVQMLCLIERLEPLTGDVSLTIAVYRPRRAGDIDNVLKVMLDSLQGFLYENDRQVSHIDIRRYEDKSDPRVEVVAVPA